MKLCPYPKEIYLPASTQHVAYANNAIGHPAYQEGNIHPNYQVANFLLSFLRHAFNNFRSCYTGLLKLPSNEKNILAF